MTSYGTGGRTDRRGDRHQTVALTLYAIVECGLIASFNFTLILFLSAASGCATTTTHDVKTKTTTASGDVVSRRAWFRLTTWSAGAFNHLITPCMRSSRTPTSTARCRQYTTDHFTHRIHLHRKKISVYPRIFSGKFLYFNGTGTVYALVSVNRRNKEARGPTFLHHSVDLKLCKTRHKISVDIPICLQCANTNIRRI